MWSGPDLEYEAGDRPPWLAPGPAPGCRSPRRSPRRPGRLAGSQRWVYRSEPWEVSAYWPFPHIGNLAFASLRPVLPPSPRQQSESRWSAARVWKFPPRTWRSCSWSNRHAAYDLYLLHILGNISTIRISSKKYADAMDNQIRTANTSFRCLFLLVFLGCRVK